MRQVQEDTQTQVLYVLNNSLQSSSEEFPFKNLSMYHLLKQVSYSCLNLVHSGEIDAIFFCEKMTDTKLTKTPANKPAPIAKGIINPS